MRECAVGVMHTRTIVVHVSSKLLTGRVLEARERGTETEGGREKWMMQMC